MRDGRGLEYYFHKVPKWEVESVGITKRPTDAPWLPNNALERFVKSLAVGAAGAGTIVAPAAPVRVSRGPLNADVMCPLKPMHPFESLLCRTPTVLGRTRSSTVLWHGTSGVWLSRWLDIQLTFQNRPLPLTLSRLSCG